MSRLVILLVIFVLYAFISVGQSKFTPSNDYLWPTNASNYASASFGETRRAHFHAALDVKTWGRKGFDVYATRDGLLHRVGRSPNGYGNVIYLKHDDGSFSVYAHLEAFNEQISKLVDSLRLRDYIFEFDRILEKENIRFKRGDVIGFTGASGVGPPHLHFELRSPLKSPFNPLLTNLKIKDKVRPGFKSIAVEPLSHDATVNGKKEIVIRNVIRKGNRFSFGEIQITGQTGLSVDAFDMADNVSNVYAVYELKLFVNDHFYFSSRIDSFSYPQARMMFLDRVYEQLKSKNRGFQRLYLRDGNELPFYEMNADKGVLNLPEGEHKIRIEAYDYYGNSSVLNGTVVKTAHVIDYDAKRRFQFNYVLNEKLKTKPDLESLLNWNWNNNWVRPILTDQSTITIKPMKLFSPYLDITFQPDDQSAIRLDTIGSARFFYDDKSVILHRIYPGKETVLRSDDQRFTLTFHPQSLYDTLSVAFNMEVDSATATAGFYLLPNHEPLKSAVTASYLLDYSLINSKTYSFYRYNKRYEKLDYIPAKVNGYEVSGRISDFGFYQILPDTTAPDLYNPSIYKLNSGAWMASVSAKDNLSGIDYVNSRFYINGIRGIVEYDPEEETIIYYHPDFKPMEENLFEIRVFDNVGNHTEKVFTVFR